LERLRDHKLTEEIQVDESYKAPRENHFMGFGANTADFMNLCGLSMEQGISVISTPEARKETAEPISLSMSFPPDTPKTPLTSGRQFLHHGATPSPSLLNPISDEDWKESTSRLSILCPKLPSPKTSEILLRRLKAGYRLVRFLTHRYEVLVDIHYFSKFMFLTHSHHCKGTPLGKQFSQHCIIPH
jgi:hypothetical protein